MRKLDNKTLDEISRIILVKSPAVRPADLDKIVSDPSLFDSIRERISQEKRPETTRRWIHTSRIRIASAAAVVIVAALAFVFAALRSEKPTIAVRQIAVPATPAKPTQFREPDMIVAPLPRMDREIEPQKASVSVSVPTTKVSKPSRKTNIDSHYEGDFYALSYAGDPHETDRGGRIIRVDIPRSTLFAMGVNIPLENEAEMVKTDLLVGTDGVTRAIRVVK